MLLFYRKNRLSTYFKNKVDNRFFPIYTKRNQQNYYVRDKIMSSKSNILQILEKNRGTYVSGEELAQQLQISRSAIWKAISELKKEGYQIISVTNKGYCLSDETDVISAEGIGPYLTNGSQDMIYVFKTVDSTNLVAKKMALEQAPHGTVVLAEEQTAGRGRMGRSFHSPAGSGIYMSFILRPNLTSNDAVLITTAASVAVARAIEEVTHIRTGIKWVNDVYMNGKKICGILTEALTDFESGGIESIILGIGINFSTAVSSFPENIQQKVDSLFHEKPAGITRNQIAAAVINHVLCLCNQLQDRSFIAEYKARSIVLGKDIEVIQGTNSEKTLPCRK